MTNPLLIDIDRRLLTEDFESFVKAAWSQVVASSYVHGRHVTLVANHLAAVARGEVSRLLINLPPSCSKSNLVAVFWPAWCWTWRPAMSFLYQSYSQAICLRDAAQCRRLVESDWYQSRWPHVALKDDDNAKHYYRNEDGGWRLSTTVSGRGTGEHPDIFVSEDGLSIEQGNSKLERESWREWYSETISSRGFAKGAAHVISQQRIHPEDCSSVADETWHHVRLPMRYDPELAMRDRGYGGDWRTTEGELLYPELIDETKVVQLERALGPRAARAQLQQDPQHSAGQFFDVAKLVQNIVETPPAKFDKLVRGWDRAATRDAGCHSAGVLLGVHQERVFILDVRRGQFEASEVLGQMSAAAVVDEGRYGMERLTTAIEQEPGSGGKESAENAVKRLRGHRVKLVKPSTNKESRAEPLATAISYGEVFLVRGAWNADFLDELRSFPAGKFKDQVDAAAMAYLAVIGQIIKKEFALSTGWGSSDSKQCQTAGCKRKARRGSDYCCDGCGMVSGFAPGEVEADHSAECNFAHSQTLSDWDDPPPSPRPQPGLRGLSRW